MTGFVIQKRRYCCFKIFHVCIDKKNIARLHNTVSQMSLRIPEDLKLT